MILWFPQTYSGKNVFLEVKPIDAQNTLQENNGPTKYEKRNVNNDSVFSAFLNTV